MRIINKKENIKYDARFDINTRQLGQMVVVYTDFAKCLNYTSIKLIRRHPFIISHDFCHFLTTSPLPM